MYSVALIGPDGAGKTTLTRRLEASGLLPFRYIYMGVNAEASNIALPTVRLVQRLKSRAGAEPVAAAEPGGTQGSGRVTRRATDVARLANRFADEWFRQAVSWYYQARGYIVLYDRHFVFDFAFEIAEGQESWDRRVHRWLLQRLYPRPSLVIFLDASGEVLYHRKGESSVKELERRRQAFLRQSPAIRHFVLVDATRPLDVVYDEVVAHIVRHVNDHGRLRHCDA